MKARVRKFHQLCAVLVGASMVGGPCLCLTSCEGLDYSAGAEGTGVQLLGAVVVLAKYRASERQKAIAEEKARAVVARMVKPAYVERRAQVTSNSAKKIQSTQKTYDKKIATARPAKTASKAEPKPKVKPQVDVVVDPAVVEVKRLEKEKAEAMVALQKQAAAELASLDTAWRSIGGVSNHSVSSGLTTESATPPTGEVPVSSTRDREVLMASAGAHLSTYIAVTVPAQGIAAERGGKATVMLWNTRLQRLASDEVLVLDRQPGGGKDIKVEGLTAQFVASTP
ncbi:hypothetical protein FEM03_16405 [Phragmitibacter flavus]|uniref:Uncharacterized protein n=1 Tax=Phragmitibacter flavus TaxID=2576071 RepID=A0A5R8KB71_9BACT|nr:hypothetical protein [Phragmitibacter flavus]TLD69541.1 hypothetical protein FEM03_16405 [Phragmitibacter flavus]